MKHLLSELRLYLANRWINQLPSHKVRLMFYRKVMRFEIGELSSIFMDCRFDCAGGLKMGSGSTINDGCYLDTRGGISIGNHVAITSGVWISTVKHDVNSAIFDARSAPVVIEDYVFVGRRAMILQGCRLGRGAVLGAGAVLTRSIPDNEIWAGNPARKIGVRESTEFKYSCEYLRFLH
jgi:acetyltransferase-like isoleucine patch superfamily enzyme